jgi:hypothetical protein
MAKNGSMGMQLYKPCDKGRLKAHLHIQFQGPILHLAWAVLRTKLFYYFNKQAGLMQNWTYL